MFIATFSHMLVIIWLVSLMKPQIWCKSKLYRIKIYFDDFASVYLQTIKRCKLEAKTMSNRPSWLWSYGSWIYNYLCYQCLSTLTLWVRILHRRSVLDTTLCDKVHQLIVAGRWFSPGTHVSSTNKTDCHNITEILLKSGIKHQNPSIKYHILKIFKYQSCV